MPDDREESARKLKATLEEMGLKEEFLAILRDPKFKQELATGIQFLMDTIKRAKEVGYLVAVAEIEDRKVRLEVACTLQKGIKKGREVDKSPTTG